MFYGGQCARAYISTWKAHHFQLKVTPPSLPVPELLKSEPRFFFPVFPFYKINLSSSIKRDTNRNYLYFSLIVCDKGKKGEKASSCSNSVFSMGLCLCLKNSAWHCKGFIKLRSGVGDWHHWLWRTCVIQPRCHCHLLFIMSIGDGQDAGLSVLSFERDHFFSHACSKQVNRDHYRHLVMTRVR